MQWLCIPGLLLALALAGTAMAAPLPPNPALSAMHEGETGAVAAVIGENALRLVSGTVAGLAAIRAKTGALATYLTPGDTIRLYHTATPPGVDRHGRRPAQVQLLQSQNDGSGKWLQEILVRDGLAWVYPAAGDTAVVVPLLQAEAAARVAGRGLWRERQNAVHSAEPPTAIPMGFGLVEGRILAIGESRHSLFLNFGADWRADFTVIVQRSDRAGFAKGLKGVRSLHGRHIRVRGWVFESGGPAIRAMHRHVIEILDEEKAQ